jgi:hypothetical protein
VGGICPVGGILAYGARQRLAVTYRHSVHEFHKLRELNIISGRSGRQLSRPDDCPCAAGHGGAHTAQHTAQAARSPDAKRNNFLFARLVFSDAICALQVYPPGGQRQRICLTPREADAICALSPVPAVARQIRQRCEKITPQRTRGGRHLTFYI